ncbi:MAG: hypothetical protein FVQ77_12820 [Cytophagales bacterium]|nr:hypothetical protein [Cytophagales bacterium]
MKSKSLFFAVLMLMGVLAFTGCSKDDPDPCDGVTCQNGGTCNGGICGCTERYTGNLCENQKTPTSIQITKVVVTDFPDKQPSGSNWDITSCCPDIYFQILKGTTLIYDSPTYKINAVSTSAPYTFTPSSSITLSSPTSNYTIRLYDYDSTSGDEYMGGILFTPYSSTNGFPSTSVVDAGAGLSFTLHLSYTF